MNLEEARDWARVSREQVSSIYGLYEDDVIVALDDRITELEVENKKLVAELAATITYHVSPIKSPLPPTAYASDKEDKG